MHYLLAQKWRIGLVTGLVTGSLLFLLIHYQLHTELGIQKPVRWLASCPPLSWHWVMDLQREVQFALLIGWWTAAGATLGWLFDGNKADKCSAVFVMVTLISAHNLSYNNFGLAVERQIRDFQQEMNHLFR